MHCCCHHFVLLAMLAFGLPSESSGKQTFPTPSSADDIIYSGSGCGDDDDDIDCVYPTKDAIIVPTIRRRPTSPGPSTTQRPSTVTLKHTTSIKTSTGSSGDGPCGDDEDDCEESSGDEPRSTDDLFFSMPTKEEKATSIATMSSIESSTARKTVSTVNRTVTKAPVRSARFSTRRPFPTRAWSYMSTTKKTITKAEPNESSEEDSSFARNLTLVLSIAIGILLLLLILAYLLYKMKNKKEGVYKVENNKPFAAANKPLLQNNGHANNSSAETVSQGRKKDTREWYV